MKYLLKQNKEHEGILCDKVTIDGFDYYVNTNHKSSKGYYLTENRFLILILKEHTHSEMFSYEGQIVSTGVYVNFINIDKFSKVIATNNPNIDIPKVVDEVEKLSLQSNEFWRYGGDYDVFEIGFKAGYKKSQETHPFSEEDIIDFLNWISKNGYPCLDNNKKEMWVFHPLDPKDYTPQELLQLWKEQKPKIVYYE